MTKTKTTTHAAKKEEKEEKQGHGMRTIRDVLEEIKAELLKLESSSSNGDFRQAARDAVAIIEKYMGAS